MTDDDPTTETPAARRSSDDRPTPRRAAIIRARAWVSRGAWGVVVTGALACWPPEPVLDQLSGSGDPTSASGMTTTQGPLTTATMATVTTTATDSTADTATTEPPTTDTGDPYPGCEDYPGSMVDECDLWLQDCPPGEKCMPWAGDGGNAWNAARCTPLDDTPDQVDESCTVEGSGVSGIDSCDRGSMCWEVDPMTNQGTCFPLCVGCPDVAACDPGRACQTANGGYIIVCVPACSPLLQDCIDGEACYPIDDDFACAADASGRMGAYGDPCEFINVCDPGLACLDAMLVPDCMGVGCCAAFCDTSNPMSQCPGAAMGEECLPWYPAGMAPAGYEDVGICRLP